jgi:exopolysaccharide production protein ExoY
MQVNEQATTVQVLPSTEITSRELRLPYVEAGRHSRQYLFAKRAMDITIALVSIVLLAPVFLAIALLIAVTDGFPIFYRQRRVGKHGEVFWIYKFRSMRKNADQILVEDEALWAEFQQNFKLAKDPRVTRFGEFLRRTSLDEFPQFVNVLLGNMSMVGPRPVVELELEELYGPSAAWYLAVKPGCAGLWQCSGRSDTSYDARIKYDIAYAEKASLGYDLQILARTFIAVVLRKGAC